MGEVIENPCYHCYIGATGRCYMTKCKYQKIAEICDKFGTDVTYLQEMAFYDIKDVIRR